MKLIFDIGSNRGLFTDKCLSLFPETKVIVIEPNPNLFVFLKEKYKKFDSIILLQNLVSSETQTLVDFYLSNTDTISTASLDWVEKSRFSGSYKWSNPIKVLSTTLDELITIYGEPDLIKIDVEGYEYEVIKGLSKKTNEICFEWAEEQIVNINKTCDHLQNLGYTDFGYIDGDDYMVRPTNYTEWYKSDFHQNIDPNRKIRWGMIWVK